jgi:hypothetical protein
MLYKNPAIQSRFKLYLVKQALGARLSLVREFLLITSGILSFSDLAFSNIDVDLMIDSLSRSA